MTDPLRHQFIKPDLKDLIPNLGNPLKLRHLGPGRFQSDYRARLGVPPVCYVMAMVVDVGGTSHLARRNASAKRKFRITGGRR